MKVIYNDKEYNVCDFCYEKRIYRYQEIYEHGSIRYATQEEKIKILVEHFVENCEWNGVKCCYYHRSILQNQWWKNKREEYIALGESKADYPVILNEYQINNLNWLLQLCWAGFVPGTNTGDWVGEIPIKLSTLINSYAKEMQHRNANYTFTQFFESYDIKPYIEKMRKDATEHGTESEKRLEERIESLKKLDALPLEEKWIGYKEDNS